MAREIRFFALVISALLLPSLATAQAPPPTKTPIVPKADQIDPNACAQARSRLDEGRGYLRNRDRKGRCFAQSHRGREVRPSFPLTMRCANAFPKQQ